MMYNFNSDIYDFLSTLAPTFNSYPTEWNDFPCISFLCENNDEASKTDGKEFSSYIAYKIDIFNKTSNFDLISQIDDYFQEHGFVRKQCHDIADPSGLVHTILRFDIYVDKFKQVYNK